MTSLALAVSAGLQVMHVLLEESVTAVAGPKGKHDNERERPPGTAARTEP